MLYSLLITFREGLEIALILGILLAALVKLDRRDAARPLWVGAGLALVLSFAGGVGMQAFSAQLSGKALEIFEGSMMLITAVILSFMVLWMQRNARGMRTEIEGKVSSALGSGSGLALGVLAFTLTVREGFETVVFLMAGAARWTNMTLYIGGAVAGAVLAIVLGVLLYRGSVHMNLRTFFTVTGWLLIFFAAGMVANGFKELHEAKVLPTLIPHIWDTYTILPDSTVFGRFLATLFGYDASPSLMQVLGYIGYLAAAGIPFWLGSRARQMSPAVRTANA